MGLLGGAWYIVSTGCAGCPSVWQEDDTWEAWVCREGAERRSFRETHQ